jgi:hypothetical protein
MAGMNTLGPLCALKDPWLTIPFEPRRPWDHPAGYQRGFEPSNPSVNSCGAHLAYQVRRFAIVLILRTSKSQSCRVPLLPSATVFDGGWAQNWAQFGSRRGHCQVYEQLRQFVPLLAPAIKFDLGVDQIVHQLSKPTAGRL